MASYSAFFSSGLLAPRHDLFPKTPSKAKNVNGFPTPYGDSSPIRPPSPLPMVGDDNDSDSQTMEIDYDAAREATPTQHSVSTSLATAGSSKPVTAAQPRLRKRRSSLTIGTSSITSIRSPTRTVGAALNLQRHLATSRSRSGSMTAPLNPPEGFGMFGSIGAAVASEGTSLMGRLRSGSVGSSLNANHHRTPTPPTGVPGRLLRRHVRRVTSVPAPAPPPSLPLPALPPPPMTVGFQKSFSRPPFVYQNNDVPGSAPTKGGFKGRDRGLSVCSSVGRIDEEMKEN